MLRGGYFCNEKLAWSGAVLGATPVTLRWGRWRGACLRAAEQGLLEGVGRTALAPLVPHSARQGPRAAAAEAPPGVRAPGLRSPVPVVSSDPLIRLGVFKMEVSAHS